uniref:Uncharacterized protein n=1 Tax=Anopheles maculatus TaxID=74869 RepID=A0A182SGM4_9DIPT
ASVDKTKPYALATPATHTRLLPSSPHHNRQEQSQHKPPHQKPIGFAPVVPYRYHNHHRYRHDHQHHYHNRNHNSQGASGQTALITPLMGQGNHSSAAGLTVTPTATTTNTTNHSILAGVASRGDYHSTIVPAVASSASRLHWQRPATNSNTTAATYKRTNTTTVGASTERTLRMDHHRQLQPNKQTTGGERQHQVHRSRIIHIIEHRSSSTDCGDEEEEEEQEEGEGEVEEEEKEAESVEYFIDIFHWVREQRHQPLQYQYQRSLSLGRQRNLRSTTGQQQPSSYHHRRRRARRQSNY